jgi:FtsP/CotA-like multicopper oxidase with cupredoxin domain
MSHANSINWGPVSRFLSVVVAAVALLLAASAHAAAPGITASTGGSSTFNLNAGPGYSSQPDGVLVYSWGYGCSVVNGATYAPAQFATIGFCPSMQLPGPTLIVTENAPFTVTLTNRLVPAGGPISINTSILFPGASTVTTSGGVAGLLTAEAIPGGTVTYTVTYSAPGTHEYYSGTQPDLQIEMGLFGAVVVRPAHPVGTSTTTPNCTTSWSAYREDFRLASSAYDHPLSCYDREYLIQWSEMDPKIHRQVEDQLKLIASCPTTAGLQFSCPTSLNVVTEPYHPNYYLINGRSMPDNMDANYAPNYPNQPYNANPHMHPGELVLVRYMGQGHWQHPFHEHGNHVRILGRDGNLLVSQTDPTLLAGRMEFNTDTTPGQADEGIFYWSGKGLGWDIFAHTATNTGNPTCSPDANGYYTVASGAGIPTYTGGVFSGGSPNYYEWCADHNHPLETNPVGQVGGGGPMTLPDPLIVTNGLWYNGTPYLGPDAVLRSRGPSPLPPGSPGQNPTPESGIAFMWHSHNEREITTNDVFPGGMLMMMLVDPYVWNIDEAL